MFEYVYSFILPVYNTVIHLIFVMLLDKHWIDGAMWTWFTTSKRKDTSIIYRPKGNSTRYTETCSQENENISQRHAKRKIRPFVSRPLKGGSFAWVREAIHIGRV